MGRTAPAPVCFLIRTVGAAPAVCQALEALAARAAREAGELLLGIFLSGAVGGVSTKSTPTDLVSEADLRSEHLLRDLILGERPQDGFLGEEEEAVGPSKGALRWLVDPLDGTVNFLFGIPQWCVSVAVEDSKGVVAGAIYDPCRDELFAGRRGGQPTLNGRPISGPPARPLPEAMVATGFYYGAAVRAVQGEIVAGLLPRVRDIRRFGSAALDLAWTAAGRYDAYFERGVKSWDVAAGTLLCERCGLAKADLPAQTVWRGPAKERVEVPSGVLVARPALLPQLLTLLSDHQQQERGLVKES